MQAGHTVTLAMPYQIRGQHAPFAAQCTCPEVCDEPYEGPWLGEHDRFMSALHTAQWHIDRAHGGHGFIAYVHRQPAHGAALSEWFEGRCSCGRSCGPWYEVEGAEQWCRGHAAQHHGPAAF
jgi:hypothetical protein